jgi:thiamine pyrophosphokinase
MAEARRLFPHSDFIHLPDQSSCDLEKAIEFSCSAGGTDIVIVSALGGRPDHSFGTYSVLCKYSQRVSLELRHERMTCRAFSAGAGGTQATSLAVRENSTVSLLPYGEGAVVSLTGTVWELHKAPLPVGAAGVSNRATGELLSLTVHAGTVLAFTELPEWVQD